MKKVIALILAAAALAVLSGCVSGTEIKCYNAGVAAYEACDFESAKALFTAANGYGNSPSYLSAIAEYERLYMDALEKFDARDYDGARLGFSAISEFGNAAEYVSFIDSLIARYGEGQAAFKAEDYPLAHERFYQSLGYRDADEYVAKIKKLEINYISAMEYYERGDLLSALEAFERIGANYRDTNERIAELTERIGENGLIMKQLLSRFTQSCDETGEPLTVTVSEMTAAGFVARASNGLLITGGTDETGYVRELSFRQDRELLNMLGEEGSIRLFAHCVHALADGGETYDEILSDIDLYFEGARAIGGFRIMLDEDGFGGETLTAARK